MFSSTAGAVHEVFSSSFEHEKATKARVRINRNLVFFLWLKFLSGKCSQNFLWHSSGYKTAGCHIFELYVSQLKSIF